MCIRDSVKTKHGADKIVKKLKFDDHSAEAIHGNLRQSKRDRVIRGFRAGKNRILVATDVAARGLDIPLIQHVINFDLPQVPEDYIHRVGRTGRAGKEGSALTFLTNNDQRTWREIQKLIDPNFNLQKNFNNFKKNKSNKFRKKGKFFRNESKSHNNNPSKKNKFKNTKRPKNFSFKKFKKNRFKKKR